MITGMNDPQAAPRCMSNIPTIYICGFMNCTSNDSRFCWSVSCSLVSKRSERLIDGLLTYDKLKIVLPLLRFGSRYSFTSGNKGLQCP